MVRILVAEDDKALNRFVCSMLTQNGYEAVPCENGAEALSEFQSKQFDMVISDIMMPDMDGFRLARSIREKGYDIPIIAISARMEPADRKKMNASGMNAFIQKPINQQLLVDKIDELISQKNNND